jgi:glycosyltransferase involved in cell wall biosynthesis
MSDTPLVSVVIATYNMAQYLPEALGSVLGQTYQNIEVVVIDDGSTDCTADTMAKYGDNPLVRFFRQENGGQASAKNHGAREAKGSFVAFLDADDQWVPEKLALQLPAFSKSERTGVVYSRVSYIDADGQETGIADNELFRGNVTAPLLIRNFIGFGGAIIRKECFDRLGGFKESLKMGIDYDLWLRASTQWDFDYIDLPLLRYRIWPGQMSRNCKGRYINGINIMKDFLASFPASVKKADIDLAWAHTFVGFGDCTRAMGEGVPAALKLYVRALTEKPTYLPAWRAIAKCMLGFGRTG